ncbi:hypothetical protein KY495_02085 [Massilia sp. PAMC28688]|uniref:hypothetical protein n=1 Tax=Massilia sp. PAMC28688 TaxID=2861283 RepID=UPI001C632ABA|nr:hypothetical protein [Massilia sp. PAMC28688]QYF94049.1 hypothetical protein KY495_02085 [Massilia sp. PAMC28688]
MSRFMRLCISLSLVSLSAITTVASAANYSLWINGRTGGGVVGNYNSFTYWGPGTTAAGVNKKSVNWDGRSSIASQSGKIRDALDCFCTGTNWCYVATHSAGDLMMGYTLANFGGSARLKKNAVAGSGGVCGNTDGSTQTGWNIKWVRAASGAAGGSELSDAGSWTTSEPLVQDLKTATARAMYDHNITRNVMFYMYAGAKGTAYSGILPGQDDEVVAYHSTGGMSGSAGAGFCNPSDWFCNDLTLGTAAAEGGRAKWSNHSVVFRDDAEAYNHYANGNWGGIVGVVRNAMVNSAL